MAYNKSYGNAGNGKSGGSKYRKKSKYTELERLAYNLGKIEGGLEADTRVRDSYIKGQTANAESKQKRKPLC